MPDLRLIDVPESAAFWLECFRDWPYGPIWNDSKLAAERWFNMQSAFLRELERRLMTPQERADDFRKRHPGLHEWMREQLEKDAAAFACGEIPRHSNQGESPTGEADQVVPVDHGDRF